MQSIPSPRGPVNVSLGGPGKTYSKRECSCYEASPGRFVVQVTVFPLRGAAEVDFYDVTPIAGAQFGRAAFRFVKAVAKAERPTYSVLLDGDNSTCDCPHGTYKADKLGPCRHVLAAQVLVKAGKLPTPRPAPKRVVRVPATTDAGQRVAVPATLDPAPQAADAYCTDDDADGPCWGPDDVVGLVTPAPKGGAA
jgi:hypothetical protein